MARTKVIDYAGGYHSGLPLLLRQAGIGIVIRYVGSAAWKCLDKAEADQLRKAGIDIACVYETSAGWMLGGWEAGRIAAMAAKAAITDCGGPPAPFVYFACDVDTQEHSKVESCLAGAASVLGKDKVGIYGGYDIVDHALKGKFAAKGWQTEAWSQGRKLSTAVLYQHVAKLWGNLGGLDYDSNEMLADDIGQWGYKKPTVADTSWAIFFAHTGNNSGLSTFNTYAHNLNKAHGTAQVPQWAYTDKVMKEIKAAIEEVIRKNTPNQGK